MNRLANLQVAKLARFFVAKVIHVSITIEIVSIKGSLSWLGGARNSADEPNEF